MAGWTPDPLLAGFSAHPLRIPDAQLAPSEPAEQLTGCLIRRDRSSSPPSGVVLYLHGWNDYFFQTHLAGFFVEAGFGFYALELRRYGRNLRPGQLAGYVTRLEDYYTELDDAVRLVHADVGGDVPILLMAHSTGGLTGALWVADRPGVVQAVILNSPWLDMQGSPMFWRLTSPLVQSMARLAPTTVVPVRDNGFYARALSADGEGEWRWDPDLKSNPAFMLRYGWLRAILAGQARVAGGLAIPVPVLSMMSAQSNFSRTWDEAMKRQDIVLDVERLAAASVHLGSQVTVLRFAGGVHDLVLSAKPVRERVFAEMSRWLATYGPTG